VAVSRSGEVSVLDDRRAASASATSCPTARPCNGKDGDSVKAGQVVATWDPHNHPIVSEVAGFVRFVRLRRRRHRHRKDRRVTGLASIEITDPKRRGGRQGRVRPMVRIVDAKGKDLQIPGTDLPAPVPAASRAPSSRCRTALQVGVGDVVAKIPQEASKTRDITGGLPRVADLFEARKPKDPAVLAERSGIVSFGKDTKGKQRLIIKDADGNEHEELIPKYRQIIVFEGEHVEKGEEVVDGEPNPQDILRLLGVEAGRVPGEGNPGRLSPAGREDQRQAHRDDPSPDAAQGRESPTPATRRFMAGEQVDRAAC
jgi:DNA-directed RNA polymerase subunit beta'